jgi:hypothetical protein
MLFHTHDGGGSQTGFALACPLGMGALMSKITTYGDIAKLRRADKLTTAEKTLIRNCKAGEETVLGDSPPDGPDDDCEVRAGLLRYLITGGCGRCKVHDWGVQLVGAYISGRLDLSFVTAKGATGLINCRFEEGVMALQARFEFLALTGSHLPGLNAQGVKVTGPVFLQGGFSAEGEVRLSGAEIGGQLSCVDGHFNNADGLALSAQGVKVTGDVFLRGGFTAEGAVSLSGAVIGGQLECDGGHFSNQGGDALIAEGMTVAGHVLFRQGFIAEGEVYLSSAVIGGNFECDGAQFLNASADALYAQNMVADQLFWRKVKDVKGVVSFAGARVKDLVDDEASWGIVDELHLNGFTYTNIFGPTAVNMRLKWIGGSQGTISEFSSLPYTDLANFYKKNGQRRNRIRTLIELEKQDRRADRWAKWYLPSGKDKTAITWPFMMLSLLFHWVLDTLYWTIGYGYRISNVFYISILLLLPATIIFDRTYEAGDFAPNSAVILTTPEWQALAESNVSNPAAEWSSKKGKGRDYETFNAFAYAADVVIPIIPLGQEAAWAPSATRGRWGYHAWWLRWMFQFAGWIVTAFGAAAITGIMRKD